MTPCEPPVMLAHDGLRFLPEVLAGPILRRYRLVIWLVGRVRSTDVDLAPRGERRSNWRWTLMLALAGGRTRCTSSTCRRHAAARNRTIGYDLLVSDAGGNTRYRRLGAASAA